MKIIPSFIAILLFSGNVLATDCSTVEKMDAADAAFSSIKSWNDVYSFFHYYKQCDDGYIAEGLSSSITHMLANNWSTVPQLAAKSDKDKAFGTWILVHIDTTVDDRELESIIKNAKERCAYSVKPFCAKVENAASQALQELKE